MQCYKFFNESVLFYKAKSFVFYVVQQLVELLLVKIELMSKMFIELRNSE